MVNLVCSGQHRNRKDKVFLCKNIHLTLSVIKNFMTFLSTFTLTVSLKEDAIP